jgi:hypothetical protein
VTIGPAVMVITSIRSMVMVFEALVTVSVIVVVALGLFARRVLRGHASVAHTPSWYVWRRGGTGIRRP